jgi:DNA-binding GntR family transcriptional regulator
MTARPEPAAPALRPLAGKSLAEQVADELRAAIHEGRYLPGARLVERTVSNELGVSHIPVREALTRLADEGLVERLPRKGSRVATLSAEELEELTSLRVLLEQFVVERVQERLAADTERELREHVQAMAVAAADGDVAALLDLDQAFHEQLWALSGHAILIELVAGLRRRITMFLRAATASLAPDELARHAASHAVLVDAIAGGDRARVRAVMAQHVQEAAERVHDALPVPTTTISEERS